LGKAELQTARRIKVKRALFNEIDTRATERVMADFSYESTKRTSPWKASMSLELSVQFRVSVVVATLALAGCNANQEVHLSSRTVPEVIARPGYNPYNPISYAQNNTGNRSGGR
jgi:hypothetical protein